MNYQSQNVGAPKSSIGDYFFSLWPVMLIIVIIVIVLIIYHKTVGYYVDYGFKRLWSLISKEEKVEVEIGDKEDPLISATLEKDDTGQNEREKQEAEEAVRREMEAERDRHRNQMAMQQQQQMNSESSDDNDGFSFNPFGSKSVSSVYNVSQNIYTYYDAPAVCKALNGELATRDQVEKAHENGADWCNYGWVKGQQAVYPTQKKTWEKLQKSSPNIATSCGKPGVNGGFFDNPELRFGVNCYGPRPPKSALDENLENQAALPLSAEEIEFDKKVQKYRENINSISVLPFKHKQ